MTNGVPDSIPFTLVGFDLDGTLVDTAEDLRAATNHALGLIGRAPIPPEGIRPLIGGGARLMLQRGLLASGGMVADATFDALESELLDHYTAHIAVHSRPFPGALAALDRLDALGVRYGVVTNKVERLARLLLDALDLSPRLSALIGGDTLGPGRGKPAPDMIHAFIARSGGGRTAFVGDSRFDTVAARAAGVPGIACAFGYPGEPVEALGADAIIAHFDELLPTLARLG